MVSWRRLGRLKCFVGVVHEWITVIYLLYEKPKGMDIGLEPGNVDEPIT